MHLQHDVVRVCLCVLCERRYRVPHHYGNAVVETMAALRGENISPSEGEQLEELHGACGGKSSRVRVNQELVLVAVSITLIKRERDKKVLAIN